VGDGRNPANNAIVLEKHGDFLRDFRGDTIHPSTLEAMHELGLLKDFLKLPHQELRQGEVKIGDVTILFVDFSQALAMSTGRPWLGLLRPAKISVPHVAETLLDIRG